MRGLRAPGYYAQPLARILRQAHAVIKVQGHMANGYPAFEGTHRGELWKRMHRKNHQEAMLQWDTMPLCSPYPRMRSSRHRRPRKCHVRLAEQRKFLWHTSIRWVELNP